MLPSAKVKNIPDTVKINNILKDSTIHIMYKTIRKQAKQLFKFLHKMFF